MSTNFAFTRTVPAQDLRTVQRIVEAMRDAVRCLEGRSDPHHVTTDCDACLTLAAVNVLAVVRPERKPLTLRQREILTFIEDSMAERGVAPSFEEIAERFDFRSLATVWEHMSNLESKGYIRRRYNEARAITLVER